jgi:hypothetical protein
MVLVVSLAAKLQLFLGSTKKTAANYALNRQNVLFLHLNTKNLKHYCDYD